jgi:hypothetical protein
MENTGHWNSDLAVLWFFMFFLPFIVLCLKQLVGVFAGLRSPQKVLHNNNTNYEQDEVTDDWIVVRESDLPDYSEHNTVITFDNSVEPEPKPKEEAPLNKEEQWQSIVDAAMQRAVEGDRAARDWVTKHVFDNPDNTIQESPFTQDVIDALKSMGYNVSDVKRAISLLTQDKDYSSAEELLQDVVQSL